MGSEPCGAVFKTAMLKIIPFLKEVKMEMKKINWPTRDQTIRYTLIVLGISSAVAIFLGGLDFIFTEIFNKLIF